MNRTNIGQDEYDDARASAQDLGYTSADFKFEETDASSLDPGLTELVGAVRVTRLSNGKSDYFAIGHKTSWPVLFEKALSQGKFGAP